MSREIRAFRMFPPSITGYSVFTEQAHGRKYKIDTSTMPPRTEQTLERHK